MYQALYRKYRPKSFDDVVDQKYIIETLKNSILVPNNCNIELIFNGLDIYVISDGKKKIYKNVLKIITKVRDDNIKFLRLSSYNFENKINTKMLN